MRVVLVGCLLILLLAPSAAVTLEIRRPGNSKALGLCEVQIYERNVLVPIDLFGKAPMQSSTAALFESMFEMDARNVARLAIDHKTDDMPGTNSNGLPAWTDACTETSVENDPFWSIELTSAEAAAIDRVVVHRHVSPGLRRDFADRAWLLTPSLAKRARAAAA